MTPSVATPDTHPSRLDALLAARTDASERFFDAEAERIGRLCHLLAERFARGGRLLAVGESSQARSDVRHVAVEFVHPVIVGKRALPAIGIAPDGGSLALQLDLLVGPDDIVVGFEPDVSVDTEGALRLARERGCLTLAFAPSDAEWVLRPPTDDPVLAQELAETTYHLLWELVHVFFEHKGLLEGRAIRPVHDAGDSAFLYPFLAETEHDLDAVLADVVRSVLMKAADATELRRSTLSGSRDELHAAAHSLRQAFESGGTLHAFGNGGSATDAMDLVADVRHPPNGTRRRPALDLTEDSAILTALANDIGPQAVFSRQLIAYARSGDVAVGFSTSGSSENVVEALREARRRELVTIAFVGYDGGRIATDGLADHVVISPSEHIPRIQEAQASAYHALLELEQAPSA